MTELVLAVLVVAMFGDRFGVTPDLAAPAAGAAWVVIYLLSCAWFPYRACPSPWCSKRRPTKGNGKGSYRRRGVCGLCKGRDWRRIGARLIGSE